MSGVILGEAEQEFKDGVENRIPAADHSRTFNTTAHPLNVGMAGMHGNYGLNVLTNECDLLIAMGMRFDDE